MIKINTKRFGEITFKEDSVIDMIGGIIGFPEYKRFIIIQHSQGLPFYWLQCLDNTDWSLLVADPLLFKQDYKPSLSQSLRQELQSEAENDISVFAVISIPPGDPNNMTANLLAPIIINSISRKARQIILDDRMYSHNHRVLNV